MLLIIECYSEIATFREARIEEVGRLALKIITANIIFRNAAGVGTALFAFFSGGSATSMGDTINGVADKIQEAILQTASSFAPDANTLAAVEVLLGNAQIPFSETASEQAANTRKAVAGFMGVNNMFAITATMGVAVMSIGMFINIVFHIVGIAIELAIYNIICPLPMACMISGHTRQIAMSFMKNYAGTAIQLGMITVILHICGVVSQSIAGTVGNLGGGSFTAITDMLAILIMPLEQIVLIYLAGAAIKRSGEMVTTVVIVLLIIAVLCYMKFGLKKNKYKGEQSARAEDEKRVEKEKSTNGINTAKNQKNEEKSIKLTTEKTVHKSIPYLKVLDNDIFLLAEKTYSKTYTFRDENYNLGDKEQQVFIIQGYMDYLKTLDDSIDCQVSVMNVKINIEKFEKSVIIDLQAEDRIDDGLDELRLEYNERVLKENITKGNNAIHKKLYLTITIRAADETRAFERFKTLDLENINSFNRIGNVGLRPLSSQERIELIKDIYLDTDVTIPNLRKEDYEEGIEKIYCSPDYFEFKANYYMWDKTFAKAVFIKDYPSRARDYLITDLINTNLELIVTTNIITHDPEKARNLTQRQLTSIKTNMGQREKDAAKHGSFGNQTPLKYENLINGYSALYKKITDGDQKLYMTNTVILIKAKSFAELNSNLEIVASSLKRNGFMFGEMQWLQEAGKADVLPIGYSRKHSYWRKRRNLPTESLAIMQPFNAKEIQQANGIYYGLNALSNNIIMFDRIKNLINPSGFILGCPGGGKSFAAKRAILEVILRYYYADVLIIDPEREYAGIVEMLNGTSIKIQLGSKNYINPFDFDFRLLDPDEDGEEVDVVGDKCQLITSFMSCMDLKNPINAQEKAFIDRCVTKTYKQSGCLESRNKKDIPTLEDFFNVMKNEENINKDIREKLTTILEYYVTGSAKYYNNHTNIDVNNRVVSFDIKELNTTMKTQSMLLILDFIWNRLSENRNSGRNTWIFMDEIYLLFADEYCLNFLKILFKRARKYGGVLTGITQNVEDLLKNDECRTMLSNSEFLMLLKQAPADIMKLKDTLGFTDSETAYVSNVDAGRGLLMLGSGGADKIAFYDKFPKDTEIYRRISTNYSEIAERIREGEKNKNANGAEN
ncbi:MAG: type IV secretion system protein [Oscillospiraceae bacterium]|nr:type IV secretion system protein [Oscillospiraceae bacterium]